MVATAVQRDQRFTKARPCPICGGGDNDVRGKERRCHGYLSSDGSYAHCSRENHAGSLPVEGGGTYAHRLSGPCKCGTTHGEASTARPEIVAVYPYRDKRGQHLFDVVRYEPKTFKQRKPDGSWGRGGAPCVLYRLPELLDADQSETVYIVEGEKDVDNMRANGFIATCGPMGANSWAHVDDLSALRGRHVVVIPDADEPGRKHAAEVAESLSGIAMSVRIVELPTKDVSDYFAAGHTADEFRALIAAGGAPEDPWQAELTKALAEVRAKLTPSNATERAPLGMDAVALLGQSFDGARWLVSGLITRNGTAIIGGEPKTTKTWAAIEIALAVATGTRAYGEFYAEPGTVDHVLLEDTGPQARNRLRALLAGSDRTLQAGRYFIQSRGAFIDITRDEDLAWIVASCRRHGPTDLLILDPLRDIHSGEEDKSDSMRDVMRRLRVLGELLGCTVLVVHHTAKAGESTAKRRPGQRLRGSGAIHGSVDSGIYLGGVGGDGRNLFRNIVDSEIKGARSAGRFMLELAVEDDDQGEATRATWTMRRDFSDLAEILADEKLSAKILRTARASAAGYESRTALYKAVGGNKQEVMSAIGAELGTDGGLEYRDGRIYARDGGS